MHRQNGIHHYDTLDNQNDSDKSIKTASLISVRYNKNMNLHSMDPV
jgi:hypothetical protein